ncbi:hypothetical protein [Phenylobacterium sp.]|uniref:hypothetical protein n=1 Tax=Phenylobacterium sp. TaxID=1871053 RepID=UPI0025D7349A|nr:hypothetical protein [Phenylobacterium sp.]
MILPLVLAMMASGPAYMIGSIDNAGVARPLRVMTYEGKPVCTIKLTDAGDHATLAASGCTAMGDFAKAVRVEGDFREQRYLDAGGAQVARGKEAEDGFWIYTPDSKRYYLTR